MSSFNVPCRECDTIIRIKHDFVSRVERELAKCPKCDTAVAEDTLIIFSRIFASDQDDLYHVLGVIDDPTNEEILSAYRRIIKHVHPDAWNIVSQETKRATLLDAATKRVNEIYETASSDQYQKNRRQEAKKKQEQARRSLQTESRARCNHCGKMVGYDPSHAGKSARCQHCGGVFQLPIQDSSSKDNPRTSSQSPEDVRNRKSSGPKTSRRPTQKQDLADNKPILFVVGGLSLVLVIVIWLVMSYSGFLGSSKAELADESDDVVQREPPSERQRPSIVPADKATPKTGGSGEFERRAREAEQRAREAEQRAREAEEREIRKRIAEEQAEMEKAAAEKAAAEKAAAKKAAYASITSSNSRANDHLNRGLDYEKRGEYENAIIEYDIAIEFDPQFAAAYFNRGVAYFNRQKYEKAITDFDRSIEINPQYFAAYGYRGDAYHFMGEHEKAIANYDRAIEIDPQPARAYHNRGWSYMQLTQYYQAITDFTETIRIYPQSAIAYHNRGLAYRKIGDNAKAEADFAEAKRLGYKPPSRASDGP